MQLIVSRVKMGKVLVFERLLDDGRSLTFGFQRALFCFFPASKLASVNVEMSVNILAHPPGPNIHSCVSLLNEKSRKEYF